MHPSPRRLALLLLLCTGAACAPAAAQGHHGKGGHHGKHGKHGGDGVVLTSACQCAGCRGEHRWAAKTSADAPPAAVPAANRVAPSTIAAWTGPGGDFGDATPRTGRELQWFAVTGRVVYAKAEPDGDLHLQMVDARGPGAPARLIAEVPDGAPWCDIRRQVFGWTGARFPLDVRKGAELALTRRPVVTVTGRALYDANNAKHGDTTRNHRSSGGATATIWEIHPVMRLTVLPDR